MGSLTGEQSTISFRELGRSDFPLLQKWLAAPHVAVWWNERFDLASLEAKYGPAIDRKEPIHVYLIQGEGVPIGWIQWYRWRDFPEHATQVGADPMSAGIDLAIGDIEMTNRGLGPAVIREFGTNYIFTNDLGRALLTAAHVVQAAASVGDVALGQLTVPVGDGRYDVATDWEVFEGIDVAVTGHERGRRLSRNEGLRERFL